VTANNVSVFGEEFGYETFPGLTDDVYQSVLQIGTDLIAYERFFVSSTVIKQKLMTTQKTFKKIQQMVNQSTSPLLSHLKASIADNKVSLDEVESLLAVVVYALAPLHTVFWVCYNLAKHPEAQRKLAQEIEVTNLLLLIFL
jgi:hypothetical protein